MKKKILIVFGTRPEAIKMCPLIKKIQTSGQYLPTVCLTGQHREMLLDVMNVFNVHFDYNLDIMADGQTLADVTIAVINGITEILNKDNFDLMLVHGDTTTSYAAALASFYKGVPVGHVEAGLRTYDLAAPFPEEFNRQSVDLLASIFFAPTKTAKDNLVNEGRNINSIFVTGNTVIDALATTVTEKYENNYLNWASDSRLIIITAHRRENIGEPMRQIFSAIKRISDEFTDVKFIYPLHKNPKVRSIAHDILAGHERIRLIEPLDVIDFHNFMKHSYLILTDSGGIQEEAPSLGVPVLVMRNTTERPEGVEAGTVKLIGTNGENIYRNVKQLLENKQEYDLMSKAVNPYGDGHASEKILAALDNYYNLNCANESH